MRLPDLSTEKVVSRKAIQETEARLGALDGAYLWKVVALKLKNAGVSDVAVNGLVNRRRQPYGVVKTSRNGGTTSRKRHGDKLLSWKRKQPIEIPGLCGSDRPSLCATRAAEQSAKRKGRQRAARPTGVYDEFRVFVV